MLLTVDPMTLGMNIFLLIGAILALATMVGVMFIVITGARMWISERRSRRSWAEYQQGRLGPDGAPMPPSTEGVCQSCGRGDRCIYFLASGEELCPRCYELFCQDHAPQTA